MSAGSSAAETYDRLWAEALRYFQSGQVEIDPFLNDKTDDRRLGLSVIGRPGAAISERFTSFLDQVKRFAPKQYFYQANEFHLTILSLFTATEAFEPHWANRAAYRAAVDQALCHGRPFSVRYRGITASKSTVMIQGFAQGPQLNLIRSDLRQALGEAGLDSGLDQRYTIETAHSTVLRFASQPKDLPRLLDLLRDNRATGFGETTFHNLQMVKNDWYMSQDKVEILARYLLSGR